MESFVNLDNFWDLPTNVNGFTTLPEDDFLALLQKQFPTGNAFDLAPPDGVDPLNINPLSIANPTPPSTDSSPSPPSVSQEPTVSRRQSGVFNNNASAGSDSSPEDPTLKRKASDDSMTDEPTHKNMHSSSDPANRKPASGPHRRKSTGNHQHDESRLLKRKEQNRAAQRAFRERKEKHVKDLEDQVAALEEKNQAAASENDNLRDLLSRLQSENMALKQAAFTFAMPKSSATSPAPMFSPQQTFFTPGASTSTSGSTVSSPITRTVSQQPQSYDAHFASLIPFDPANMLDESTSDEGAMNLDYGFGQPNGMSPYKTIASNPMYMSFAEPTPYDLSPPPMHPILQSPASPTDSHSSPLSGIPTFAWNSPTATNPASSPTSLDHLFGGFHGAQSPVDFQALLASSPSSVSPVSHATVRSNTASSSSGSPGVPSSNGNSPVPPSAIHSILPGGTEGCPRTREEVSKMIQQQGSSAFVQDQQSSMRPQSGGLYQSNDPAGESCQRLTKDTLMASVQNQSAGDETVVGPNGGFVRKMTDGTGSIVMCKGSSFPKTEKSDMNIEVLTAWRTITSNPQFKNVDINELCSEFTKKARCDGTKVVLEPQGVHDIIETLGKQRQ